MDNKTYSYTEQEIQAIHNLAEKMPYNEVITKLSDGYVPESKALSRILEPTCCKLISEFMRQADFYEKYPNKYTEFFESGWFYCTIDIIEMNTGLTERQQFYAIDKLVGDGLLKVDYGKNKRRKIQLNKSKIVSLILGCNKPTFNPLDFDNKDVPEMKSISRSKNAKTFAKLYEFGILQNVGNDMLKSMGLDPTLCRQLYNIKQYIFFSINKFILKNIRNTNQSGDLLVEMKKRLIEMEEETKGLKITGTRKKSNTSTKSTQSKQPKCKKNEISEEEELQTYLECVRTKISQAFVIYDKHKLQVIVDWFDSIWDKGVRNTKRSRFLNCVKDLDKYMKLYSWDKLEELLRVCTVNAYCSLDWGIPKQQKNKYNTNDRRIIDIREGETDEELVERKNKEARDCYERRKNYTGKLV